jgi:hypothetical protein
MKQIHGDKRGSKEQYEVEKEYSTMEVFVFVTQQHILKIDLKEL